MKTKWILAGLLALGIAAFGMTGCKKSPADSQTAQGISTNQAAQDIKTNQATPVVQYTCPMHPEVVQDKPGHCPKCGMKLVEKK